MKNHLGHLVVVFMVFFCSAIKTVEAQDTIDLPPIIDRYQGEIQEIFFSTEEDFITQGPEPSDGNPIISDGDLLSSAGYVYMRNLELTRNFKAVYDLGLDAVDVINVRDRIVAFSTELDHPQGMFSAGDLLFTNGSIIPNAALLSSFNIPRGLDLGLDAVQIVGEESNIQNFVQIVKERGSSQFQQNPALLLELLKQYQVDIWFSTEGTAPTPQKPLFLDGDLLSANSGAIVLKNSNALPATVPAGIPLRGVDFGLDAVTLSFDIANDINIDLTHLSDQVASLRRPIYSTEINGKRDWFTNGDALIAGNGVVLNNFDLIAAFEPKVKDLGLDALSYRITASIPQCGFTKIGGIEVSPTTWDFATGYVDPTLTGRKDHAFGRWISVRGILPADADKHRVLVRAEGGTDSPILMPATLNWRVHLAGPFWKPVVIDGDGWMDSSDWIDLRDVYHNNDLIFVNWNSTTVPDGKYIMSLQVMDAGGSIRTCQEISLNVDNTKPVIDIPDTHECHEYQTADMPLTISGAMSDGDVLMLPELKHFYRFRITLDSYWLATPAQFDQGYYYDGAPLDDDGTVGYPVPTVLGTLDIPALLGDKAHDGRYTVTYYAYDRSLLGYFNASSNYIADGYERNWWFRITNFEFQN